MRLRKEKYPHRFETMINESVLTPSSQISTGISLFIDELLSSNKFSNGSAMVILSDLAEEIRIWNEKNGIDYLTKALIVSLKKYDNEYLEIVAIDFIEKFAHYFDYQTFLEVFHESKSIYARKKSLQCLKNILKHPEYVGMSLTPNIDIINSLKVALDDDIFEIRWIASKTISDWLEDLEPYDIPNRELVKNDIDVKQIKNKLYEITYEFSRRMIEHFEREGTEKEKKMIEELRIKRDRKKRDGLSKEKKIRYLKEIEERRRKEEEKFLKERIAEEKEEEEIKFLREEIEELKTIIKRLVEEKRSGA
jgi:hypothetical protein